MNDLNIYPEQRLIVLVYHGDVTINDVIQATKDMVALPNFSNEFDGIADYRDANVRFTVKELAGLTQKVKDDDMAHGTWCLLATTPLETAMMAFFQKQLHDLHPISIFSTVAAASSYLGCDLSLYLDETK